MKSGVMEEVKRLFKPEFINRIDEINGIPSVTQRKYETDYYPLGQESVKTVQRADGYQPDTDFLFKRIYHRGTCGQQDGGKAIETCHTDGD